MYIYKHHDQPTFVWTVQIIVEPQKFVSAHTYLKILETSMTIAFYLKHNKGSISPSIFEDLFESLGEISKELKVLVRL